MANKQVNITNNSPNYTKNNSINNLNYVQRNGAGWSWFKTIFIACMLTIFSVVCFAGGKDAIPQGYTNSIRQETITIQTGGDLIYPDQDEIFSKLAPDNIYNYVFEFVNTDNYIPYISHTSNTQNYIIDTSSGTQWAYLYNNSYGYTGSCYLKNDFTEWVSSSEVSINASYEINGGKSGRLMYFKNSNGYYINKATAFSIPFSFKLFQSGVQYIRNFELFKQWLSNNFIVTNLEIVDTRTYVEYPITYATYDWDIKLRQLGKLKNVFTPLFSSNIPDEQATLQKGFDQFQELMDLGVLTYTGDKITPNRKMSENWEYNVNISSFTKFDEMIHLLTSNLGKYINANYWYDSTTRKFVRFDTNIIYGSINDTNTTLQNVINLLSYPITTGFNITYNIGVLFTFIFVW